MFQAIVPEGGAEDHVGGLPIRPTTGRYIRSTSAAAAEILTAAAAATAVIICPADATQNSPEVYGNRASARSASRSASTIMVINSSKETVGCQPSTFLALAASPTSRSTSAGRTKRASTAT